MNEQIKVSIDGRPAKAVTRKVYVEAKTKQLRAFGYTTLTEKEVDEQITALLEKKSFGDGLTVIGMFMDGEIFVP